MYIIKLKLKQLLYSTSSKKTLNQKNLSLLLVKVITKVMKLVQEETNHSGMNSILIRLKIKKVHKKIHFRNQKIDIQGPDFSQGEYKTRILTSTGYGKRGWAQVEFQITSISKTTTVQGGQNIEIEGSGFVEDNELEVQKTGHRKLKCRTPRITTNAGYGNLQAKSSCQFSTNLTVTNIGQPAITQINNNAGIVYVSGKSAYTYNVSTETLTFNILGTNLSATTLNFLLEKDGLDDVVGTIFYNNAKLIQVSFSYVPLGQFDIVVQCDDKVGIWRTQEFQKIIFQNPVMSGSLPKASCIGGNNLEINIYGFMRDIMQKFVERNVILQMLIIKVYYVEYQILTQFRLKKYRRDCNPKITSLTMKNSELVKKIL